MYCTYIYICVCIGNGDQIIVTFSNHNGEIGDGIVDMLPDKSSVFCWSCSVIASSKSFVIFMM